MSKVALAIKYRPKTWGDVCEQKYIKDILENQIKTNSIKNAYLFCGGAGTGKTTTARIFANEINEKQGNPIEVDAASNNGVDNVRTIIDDAKFKPLESKYKVYIIDECFPANTKIQLKNSLKDIKDIKVGDIVKHMTGYDKVTYVFKNSVLTKNLCCVKINNRTIITTKNHLFFTNNGWVEAQNLQEGDYLYDTTSMSKLWQTIQKQTQGSEVLLSSMFSEISKKDLSTDNKDSNLSSMWKRIPIKELGENKDVFKELQKSTYIKIGEKDNAIRVWTNAFETIIRKNESKQSNEQSISKGENVKNQEEQWNTSSMEWDEGWKWQIYYTSNSAVERIRNWMGIGIPDKNSDNKGLQSNEISYELQSRPSLYRNENCNRGGWQRPQLEKSIIEGLKENGLFKGIRVESVEIYERGNNDQLFSSSFTSEELSKEYVTMYDLEVENDHTYFADNILVHNCHMLSTGAWNAMLKLLEEPPKTTIFILCTTDPQKIPGTILSRVQRYDFQRISFEGIVERLNYIIDMENFENKPQILTNDIELDREIFNDNHIDFEKEAIEYIAKVADGGMRDAISLMDKCLSFNKKLTVDNVVKALGISDYDNLNKLVEYILCNNSKGCIDIIENIYRNGKDLKQFIKQSIQFVLDISKYLIYESYDYIQIPNTIDLKYYKDFEYDNILDILDMLLDLSNKIKYETNPKISIESKLLIICKGR